VVLGKKRVVKEQVEEVDKKRAIQKGICISIQKKKNGISMNLETKTYPGEEKVVASRARVFVTAAWRVRSSHQQTKKKVGLEMAEWGGTPGLEGK